MFSILSKPVGTLYRSSTDAQKFKKYYIASVEEKSLLSYVKIVSAALICSVYTDIMSCGAGALNILFRHRKYIVLICFYISVYCTVRTCCKSMKQERKYVQLQIDGNTCMR